MAKSRKIEKELAKRSSCFYAQSAEPFIVQNNTRLRHAGRSKKTAPAL
jgi:hypothetical protein